MNFPTLAILMLGLRQLNAKWMNKNGVTRVALQTDPESKMPGYYMEGQTAEIPQGLPNRMFVPGNDGRPFGVPVYWRQDTSTPVSQPILNNRPEIFNPRGNAKLPLDPMADEDIDKAYWFFATPANLNRTVKNYLPAFHTIPTPTNMEPPPAKEIDTQYHVDMRLPQYDNPNFWSKPFEPSGCLCCTYYMRPTIIYSYVVPDTYLLVLNGISYDIPTVLPFGTIFQVDIYGRTGLAASFEEIVVDPANPDPSKRVAFASHESPTPLFVLVDRGETLTVKITVKGPWPFVKTDMDTFCGTICVLLHGWIASLVDNRDGAMRPSDVGEWREGVGNETLPEVSEEYVKTLLAWIGAVTGSV